MRRAFWAALAAAVALAGCGSDGTDTANRYVDAVNHAQARFAGTVQALSGRISASSTPAADRRVLRRFDTALARVVGDLRAIDPPGDVAPLHRRLVGEMDRYGARVRRESATLRSDDPRRLVAAQQRLLAATDAVSRRINTTIAAINRRLAR